MLNATIQILTLMVLNVIIVNNKHKRQTLNIKMCIFENTIATTPLSMIIYFIIPKKVEQTFTSSDFPSVILKFARDRSTIIPSIKFFYLFRISPIHHLKTGLTKQLV